MKRLGNVFYNRSVVVGPEWMFLLITILIITTPPVISFVFDSTLLIGIFPIFTILIAVFLAFALFFLLCTAFADPGFIPPDCSHKEDLVSNDSWSVLHRPSIVRASFPGQSDVFVSRLCNKCQIFKPPGVHHCSTCDCCTRHFDHHCSWIGTCVGERNYGVFLWFITTLSVLFLLIAVSGYLSVFYVAGSISDAPISFANAVFATLVFSFPFFLLLFHLQLLSHGLSTIDHIKGQPHAHQFSCKTFLSTIKRRFTTFPWSIPSYIHSPSSAKYAIPVNDPLQTSHDVDDVVDRVQSVTPNLISTIRLSPSSTRTRSASESSIPNRAPPVDMDTQHDFPECAIELDDQCIDKTP
ncbi:hypothetical protein P9112_008814 [Eukaryota sp. TZLM1-RC]